MLAFTVSAGIAGAILIGRWGWRQARHYLRARDAIRRITPKIQREPIKFRKD